MRHALKPLRVTGIIMLGLLCAMLIFLSVVAYRPDAIEPVSIEGETESTISIGEPHDIMTFNIGYGGLPASEAYDLSLFSNGRPDDAFVVMDTLEGVKDTLKDAESDIYLLQEVDKDARRSHGIDQVTFIRERLGETAHHSMFTPNLKAPFVPYPLSWTDRIGRVESGLQTISGFHAEKAQRHAFDTDYPWPVGTVTFKRAMLVTYIPVEGRDNHLVLINLHLSPFDATRSKAELEHLERFMQKELEKGNYVIAGGDFNRTFPGAETLYPSIEGIPDAPLLDETLFEQYTLAYDITTPTKRSTNEPYTNQEGTIQYYLIDGFIVTENVEVNKVETLDEGFAYSDHNPVVMTFTLLP